MTTEPTGTLLLPLSHFLSLSFFDFVFFFLLLKIFSVCCNRRSRSKTFVEPHRFFLDHWNFNARDKSWIGRSMCAEFSCQFNYRCESLIPSMPIKLFIGSVTCLWHTWNFGSCAFSKKWVRKSRKKHLWKPKSTQSVRCSDILAWLESGKEILYTSFSRTFFLYNKIKSILYALRFYFDLFGPFLPFPRSAPSI